MSETFKLKNYGDFVEWFLVLAIAELDEKIKLLPSGGLEVCLQVNGVEVPFVKVMRHVDSLRQTAIMTKAKELAAQIVLENFETIQELINEARQGLRENLQEAGLIEHA